MALGLPVIVTAVEDTWRDVLSCDLQKLKELATSGADEEETEAVLREMILAISLRRWKRMIWLAIICSLALRLILHFLAFLAFPQNGLTTENRQYTSYVLKLEIHR